ncbi:MAG: caspase family protein, partial [Candidatus Obscuribacterales bacterium]|nr:caspase family protein [Candidatus Obscuribacterales bacterium]
MKKFILLSIVITAIFTGPCLTCHSAEKNSPEPVSESAGDSEKTTSKTSKNSTTESMEQRADRPIKDKWALVVGISKFKEEKFNLKFAAKDAVDFARFLTQECSFASDHVLVLTDDKATRANVLGALGGKWLPRLAL